MDWIYQGIVVDEIPEGVFGFIYKLTYESGKAYIGKKQLLSKKTIKALKSGEIREGATRIYKIVLLDEDGKVVVSRKDKREARKRGLKATKEPFDVLYSQSDWKSYEGSHEVPEDEILVKKEILTIALDSANLTYAEIFFQMHYQVLADDKYLNKNINNMIFASQNIQRITI